MLWRKKEITFTEKEVEELINKIKNETHDNRCNECITRIYFVWLITTKNNK